MGNYILELPGNREYSLINPTGELTEDISDIFSLLFSVTHTGVEQNGIQNPREDDDKDAAMDDVMSPSQDTVCGISLLMG